MQVLIRVICSGHGSLRERIVKDKKLEDHNLKVSMQKTAGRNPGWAKLHSTEYPGAINIYWDGHVRTLVCWVVTKSSNKPDDIIGDFSAYLLARHRKRIKAILL